jgi:hypothetical protein
MFVRLARFEGGAIEDIEAEARQVSSALEAARRGETSEYLPQGLADRVERIELLADRSNGCVAMLVYCASEDDCREVDRIMDGMSPQRNGWGHRVSRDVYEVLDDGTIEARRAA